MKRQRHAVEMASGLGRLWARSGLAHAERQAAEALRLFGDSNNYLRSHAHAQGRRAASLALRTLAVPADSEAGRAVLAAVGAAERHVVEPEALADDLRGVDFHRLVALTRGLAYLGSFCASAAVRRVARDVLLESRPDVQSANGLTYLAALTDAGRTAEARSILDLNVEHLEPNRAVRSLALACGYSEDWVWRGWTPQPATRDLVGGSEVLLVGPSQRLSDSTDSATRQSIVAAFKYCGRRGDAASESRVDISVLNGHAYAELQRRFASRDGTYTMSPCSLLLYRNKSRPPYDLGIPVERLQARPELMVEKANTGLMAITELLLAGAGALRVTGFDLWTRAVTARPEYHFYAPDNRTRPEGGLDQGSVARSAGIHEPISQFNFLKRLVEVGRVDPDETLRRVLSMSEDQYASQLESQHGLPFAKGDDGEYGRP